ncbi:Hypothetical protein NTJ_03633 [Nesidiocoris tenuis]|uniref:Uncharacterized protein n=1 Tax=Nesidiocoris tenuis TaxID=355587 RepID=A0ABN7AIX9_9HEMI|nr:Hypothetical protein NTJ_03633 [Nesidiocoris tenuis]
MAEFSGLVVESHIDMNVNPTNDPPFDIMDPSTWDPDDPILWMHKEWYYKYKGETPPVHPTGTEIMTRQGSQTAPAPSTAPVEDNPAGLSGRRLKAELSCYAKPEWVINSLEQTGHLEEIEQDWYAEIKEHLDPNDRDINNDWVVWHANFTYNFEVKVSRPERDNPLPINKMKRDEKVKEKDKKIIKKPLAALYEDYSKYLDKTIAVMLNIEKLTSGLNITLSAYQNTAKTAKGRKFNSIEIRKRNELVNRYKYAKMVSLFSMINGINKFGSHARSNERAVDMNTTGFSSNYSTLHHYPDLSS